MLGRWLVRANTYGKHAKGIFFRRELPQLEAVMARAKELFNPIAPIEECWSETKKTWTFPNGATLKFRQLERDSDAEKYQGHDYTDIFFEELTNYPDPAPVNKLKATLRSAAGVPPHFCATGNPGGPGHHWVKHRYIDPSPQGFTVLKDKEGLERVFIPAKLRDNKILTTMDAQYETRLKQSGSEQLVKAWLDGDWNIVEGAYFDCWNASLHVVRPFEIPHHWLRFRSFDWGSAAPFSVGWWAVASEDHAIEDRIIPKNSIVRYREWYGAKAPNVGLKFTAEQVAEGIWYREQGEKITYGVADPACFARDGGPSIVERMFNATYQGKKLKIAWQPADNKRLPGWDQMRQRMVGYKDADGREKPMMYIFGTCVDFIRTVPLVQHAERNPEDVDTTGEDHCFAAGTLVDTSNGQVPIEQLPSSGYVRSIGGIKAYRSARKTREKAPVIELTFSNGKQIVCTRDHKFLTRKGWMQAQDLVGEKVTLTKELECQSPLSLIRFRNLKAVDITNAARIFSATASDFTAKFGKACMEKFRKALTSITSMGTAQTTHLKTSNAYQSRSTLATGTGQQLLSEALSTYPWHGRRLKNGTALKKGGPGTSSNTNSIVAQSLLFDVRGFANNAGQNTPQHIPTSSVQIGVSQHGAALMDAMTCNVNASSVQNHSRPTNILSPSAALKNVEQRQAQKRGVVCLSLREAGQADVYCLTVPSTKAFSIEGGIIVHNCADEARYGCMSRPWMKEKPKTEEDLTGLESMSLDDLWEQERKRRAY